MNEDDPESYPADTGRNLIGVNDNEKEPVNIQLKHHSFEKSKSEASGSLYQSPNYYSGKASDQDANMSFGNIS